MAGAGSFGPGTALQCQPWRVGRVERNNRIRQKGMMFQKQVPPGGLFVVNLFVFSVLVFKRPSPVHFDNIYIVTAPKK